MAEIEKIKECWQSAQNYVRKEFEITDVSYNNWIGPLEALRTRRDDEGHLVLDVLLPQDNSALNSWWTRKYSQMFRVAIEETSGIDCRINIMSKADLASEGNRPSIINTDKQKVDNYSLLLANLNTKYTFDSFVVGNSNSFAHAASLAVAESPGENEYNPLFLYGGVGLGKTHLMQAIAHYILEKDPSKKVLYVTSENFTNELVDAIHKKTTLEFREKYRYNDVLLIDDIQFIIGKEATQEEFFNTFNDMYQNKKQIVISSDRPPKEFNTLEERIKSRLSWGIQADIQTPDYETRLSILRKKEENDGISIDNEVLKYIAETISSNIRDLEGALNKVRMASKLNHGQSIDLDFVKEVLKDSLNTSDKKSLTPEYILDVISDHFSISKQDIASSKRTKELVYPRQIAMYLMKKLTNCSLDSIGTLLGGRDHSTIIHGIDKVKDDLLINNELSKDISVLEKKLST